LGEKESAEPEKLWGAIVYPGFEEFEPMDKVGDITTKGLFRGIRFVQPHFWDLT